MILEVRIYRLQPGRREEWSSLYENVVKPFMVSKGMRVGDSFVDREDDQVFVWFRSFDTEEQRLAQYAAVYEDEFWLSSIQPAVLPLLDGMPLVHRVEESSTVAK